MADRIEEPDPYRVPQGDTPDNDPHVTLSGGSGWGGVANALFSGDSSPIGVVTPNAEGDLYTDNTTPAVWQATGTTNADWQLISVPGNPNVEGVDIVGYQNGQLFLPDYGQITVFLHDSGPLPSFPISVSKALTPLNSISALSPSAPFGQQIDVIPPGGHMGPGIFWQSIDTSVVNTFDYPFHINWLEYGVLKLDGSASFRVVNAGGARNGTKIVAPNTAAPAGTYNLDDTLLDWAGAVITGTDLSKNPDAFNVISAAGGVFWIYAIIDAYTDA